MKTFKVRFLSAFFALAALAVAARSQDLDKLIVNIPHDFVAAGKTLPAGTYEVLRVNDFNNRELSLTSFENRDGVLLVSTVVSSTNEDKPAITFERVGDQYFLSKIETASHIFTIAVPQQQGTEVAMKKQTSPATSGASGSN
jgi:hypothetical protein